MDEGEGKSCPTCGITQSQFTKSGFLGCPDCYKVFSESIDPMFLRTQMGSKHVGRKPGIEDGGAQTSEVDIPDGKGDTSAPDCGKMNPDAGKEIHETITGLKANYDRIILIANSIGAHFSMNADIERYVAHAYFISPIVDIMSDTGNGSTAYDIVKKYTEEKVGKYTGAEVVAHCPSIGRSSALAALKRLTEEGLIIREGSGRSTFYVRADSK